MSVFNGFDGVPCGECDGCNCTMSGDGIIFTSTATGYYGSLNINTTDSSCLSLSGSGTLADPLTGDIIVDPASPLSCTPDGISLDFCDYTPPIVSEGVVYVKNDPDCLAVLNTNSTTIGQVLTSDGTNASWQDIPGTITSMMQTAGVSASANVVTNGQAPTTDFGTWQFYAYTHPTVLTFTAPTNPDPLNYVWRLHIDFSFYMNKTVQSAVVGSSQVGFTADPVVQGGSIIDISTVNPEHRGAFRDDLDGGNSVNSSLVLDVIPNQTGNTTIGVSGRVYQHSASTNNSVGGMDMTYSANGIWLLQKI